MITLTGDLETVQNPLDVPHLAIRQFGRGGVFVDALGGGGARDRDDLRHARLRRELDEPAESQLGGGAALARGDLLELPDELEVGVEVLGLEAGELLAEVALRDVLVRFDLSGQDAAADRGVASKTISLFALKRTFPARPHLRSDWNIQFGTGFGDTIGQWLSRP